MGNCISNIDEEPEDFPYIHQVDNNIVELLEDPKLTFNKNHKVTNDENLYGGVIFIGQLSEKQVFLKLIHNFEKNAMERETKLLLDLNHKNIASIMFPLNVDNNQWFLVTENFGKNVSTYIKVWNVSERKQIMLQLVDVISYLQSKKIVHLELFQRNIFIIEGHASPVVKLINFHNARQLKDNSMKYTFNDSISVYRAPEILERQQIHLSSDIYSLGCIFFYILSEGLQMVQIKSWNERPKIIATLKKIEKFDSALNVLGKHLIEQMLIYEHNKRAKTDEIKNHPFFWPVENKAFLIIESAKLTEKDSKFKNELFKSAKRVTNGNWVQKIEPDVMNKLQEIRQAYQLKTGANQEDFDGRSILSLLKTIRNVLVHPQSHEIGKIMGYTLDDVIKYWSDKFPLFILHLYKTKLFYNNNENLS